MTSGDDSPLIDQNSPLLQLSIPPVGILLLATVGYFILFLIIIIFRYLLRSKGVCEGDLFYCGADVPGCCQCLESCSDACTCGTPTLTQCLDACCPKRNMDLVGIILCQCCGEPDTPCCNNQNACCTYGDLNCNCACIQPEDNTINCCCCQIGTSNQNRQDDLEY